MKAITKRGASMDLDALNPYGVGLMRLNEMAISNTRLSREDIEYIGKCSINRKKVVIGKIGNSWVVQGRAHSLDAKFKPYYVIRGKRITMLYHSNATGKTLEQMMSEYECRDLSKPLYQASADEIFQAAKGRRSQKHGGKGNSHADIGKYKNRPYVSLTNFGY